MARRALPARLQSIVNDSSIGPPGELVRYLARLASSENYLRKMPESTALYPALRSMVIVTDPPAETLMGTWIQIP